MRPIAGLVEAAAETTTARPVTALDVLVIGAGQAGLATAYHLRSTGLRYELLERHSRIGDSWRMRFDSLALFTPRSYSALPGLVLDGDPEGFATKDEIADYLERYAQHFALPVRLSAEAKSLERIDDRFRARTADGSIVDAEAVVIASGAFQTPAVPQLASGFSGGVTQLTPDTYANPAGVPVGTVLVAGDGATGRHIARELAATHCVVLAAGRRRRLTPDRILGRSAFWWLDRLGLLRVSRDSRIGRWLRSRDPFPGRGLDLAHLRSAGVAIVPRLTRAHGITAGFADGSSCEVAAVVWATGYRDDSSWVWISGAVDETGRFQESRGISPVPGLFFVGRSWQRSRGSALLLGAGEDAKFIVSQIIHGLGARILQSPVAQWIERRPPEPAGSRWRCERGRLSETSWVVRSIHDPRSERHRGLQLAWRLRTWPTGRTERQNGHPI
jgi:putative flavoprotein involved in K+ transport